MCDLNRFCAGLLLKVLSVKNSTLLSDLGEDGKNHRIIELS